MKYSKQKYRIIRFFSRVSSTFVLISKVIFNIFYSRKIFECKPYLRNFLGKIPSIFKKTEYHLSTIAQRKLWY